MGLVAKRIKQQQQMTGDPFNGQTGCESPL
jgi:hypothetical protein